MKALITSLLLHLAFSLYGQEPVVSTIRLEVFDVHEGQPIDAVVKMYLNSDYILKDSDSIINGAYQAELDGFGWYMIEIHSPGYMNYSDTIWLTKNRTIEKKYGLLPIDVGYRITLQNIQFHFNSAWLSSRSHAILDSIAAFIQTHPELIFEVAGHTDDEGDEHYNRVLSQQRADAIVQYLVDKGIESCRLVAKGYGEAKLVDDGVTKAAKARNRRVEFVVIEARSEAGTIP